MKIWHKFNAVRTECDGISFPSKREARAYQTLKASVASGQTVFFLRQVPLHLPGGVRYVVDFLAFDTDGSVRFIESKGMKTESYKAKKKIVEAIYPITIEEW